MSKIIMSKEFNSREDYIDYCNEMYSKGMNIVRKPGYKVDVLEKVKTA